MTQQDERERRGRRRTMLLVLLSGSLVTGAVAYMMATTISAGDALEYFKHVDEIVGKAHGDVDWSSRRLRLHGNVVKGTILKKKGALKYRFALYHGNEWIEVKYRGLVPDTFRDCAEVVAKGRLAKDGRSFTADAVTAKCPSKYDEEVRSKGCGEKVQARVQAGRKGSSGQT